MTFTGDAVIAIDGGPGTLSVTGFVFVHDRRVAGLDTHPMAGVHTLTRPAMASTT